jgi:hypothetical protein
MHSVRTPVDVISIKKTLDSMAQTTSRLIETTPAMSPKHGSSKIINVEAAKRTKTIMESRATMVIGAMKRGASASLIERRKKSMGAATTEA